MPQKKGAANAAPWVLLKAFYALLRSVCLETLGFTNLAAPKTLFARTIFNKKRATDPNLLKEL
ncbi:hypothetical protein RN22_17975 [Grimontia sp. AD028]|nr:hypothetical protein RN22_17975 [Grimontia sp. AD028]